ncbi:MAG: hypothetical protein V3V26_01930 [Candidatus Aenigmarchaeota archaeon]
MIFGGLLDVVVVVFLVLVFAEYIKLRAKVDKPMKFLAGSALLFLLAWSFGGLSVFTTYAGSAAMYGTQLFEILGWILLLVAALWGTLELIKK